MIKKKTRMKKARTTKQSEMFSKDLLDDGNTLSTKDLKSTRVFDESYDDDSDKFDDLLDKYGY